MSVVQKDARGQKYVVGDRVRVVNQLPAGVDSAPTPPAGSIGVVRGIDGAFVRVEVSSYPRGADAPSPYWPHCSGELEPAPYHAYQVYKQHVDRNGGMYFRLVGLVEVAEPDEPLDRPLAAGLRAINVLGEDLTSTFAVRRTSALNEGGITVLRKTSYPAVERVTL